MSRKITVGAALALALLLVAASIPLTMIHAQKQQNKLIPDLPALIGRFNALDEIKRKVDDNFYAEPAWDVVNAAMVRGYIEGLGDAESRYLSEEEYKNYAQRLRGEASELGILLKYDPDVLGLVIDQVKAGSTAAVSGLRPEDHIIKAESGGKALSITEEVLPNESTKAIDTFYAETAVAADTSSIAITITYKRGGVSQQPVNIMLGSAASTITAYMMDAWAQPGEASEKTVGYIKIHQFFKNTADQIETAVKDLSRQDAVSYILDVRGCREGNLESVCKAIDLFAYVSRDSDAMVTVHYRDKTTRPIPSTSKNIMSYTTGGFVVVLTDGRTSGVAELFAHDLRAFNPGKVYLVGEPTKGINTVQEPFPLNSVGGAALLTVGTVVPYGVPASGYATWNEKGVQPNTPTEAEANAGIIYLIKGAEQQRIRAVSVLHELAELKSKSNTQP